MAELEQELDVMAGNKMQRQRLEKKMLDAEDHPASIRESLRKTFTNLHQLALVCGVEATIPQHPNETSVATALHELAGAMEVIPSKHSAKIREEMVNGVHTGACHVLACVKIARPDVDLKDALEKGEADDTCEDVMSSVADLRESIPPFYEG